MRISNIPDEQEDFSPQDESEELVPQFNPATSERPIPMDEEEWLASFSGILDISPEYNPATMDFIDTDKSD